jgi:hypothetical protein
MAIIRISACFAKPIRLDDIQRSNCWRAKPTVLVLASEQRSSEMAMQIRAYQITDILTNMPDEWRFGGALVVSGHLGVLIQKVGNVITGQGETLLEAVRA